jgi:carboxyl-terminal processing protease
MGVLAPGGASATLRCEMLPSFVHSYLQHHVRFRTMTPELEQRAIDTYLHRLDPGRSLLTATDSAEIAADLKGIFAKIQSGDCSKLSALHQEFIKRNQKVLDLVKKVLGDDAYAIDSTVELLIDPDDRGYPEDAEAQEKLLRSLIHFQISNYLGSDSSLKEARERLIRRYVRRQNRLEALSEEDLYSTFLDTFALSLDPHSNYLSADTWEDFKIQMTLSLEGIGVALTERDGYAVVEHIIPGGAADRQQGLIPKDKIIAVSQEGGKPVDIIDMPLREAVSLIRGERGTKVILTVLRQGEKTERLNVAIVRDRINLVEAAASLRFEEVSVDGHDLKLGVLELPSFYGDSADPDERQSAQDVAKLLKEANEAKIDGLILDLSRNGGGLLEQAVTISGFFLRTGEIVRVEARRGHQQPYFDPDESTLYSGPMVVHTSRMSASASEILAGALKDYGRAVIAGGDHTFGKGTVQSVQALPPGQGAFKITTAMFFRPGGRSTQHSGVKADVVIPSIYSTDELGEKTQRYSLPPNHVAPFLSKTANDTRAGNRWQPVGGEVLAVLSTKSLSRVEASEEFKEIRVKVMERRKAGSLMRLADILKDQNNGTSNKDEDADPAEEDGDIAESDGGKVKTTPELREAVRVLADLVVLTDPSTLASRTP